MPRIASCCCPHHATWGHTNFCELRVASEKEKDFCGIDSDGRHKDRKRKICTFCRDRIRVELISYNAQNHQTLQAAGLTIQPTEVEGHYEPEIIPDDDYHPVNITMQDEIPQEFDEIDFAQLISPITLDEQTNQAEYSDKETQIGSSIPRLPYHNYENRKKTDIRTAVINDIHTLLLDYVHNDKAAVNNLLQDVLKSRVWKSTFGNGDTSSKGECMDKTVKAIAEEYQRCKMKETNAEIREREKQIKQPIKIGRTKGHSEISEGSADNFSTRVEAAKEMGRVTIYGAERRRLLSIVASDYPQAFLTTLFKCSKSTVTAARVHCILFGRGGTPPKSLKFTRQRVSQDVLDGLAEFFVRDNVSRPSSCRSVVINKEECPVRYWQDSLKTLIQQYQLEFPNGVKHTYIYSHIPQNFRQNSMLAGLCNLCEDYGYSNFESIKDTIKNLSLESGVHEDLSRVREEITCLQRYMKSKFSNEASNHSSCLELCMSHALDGCSLDHVDESPGYNRIYHVYNKINAAVEQVPLPRREEYSKQLQEFKKNFTDYVGHLVRTKHQGEYYRYVQKHLKCGEAIVIIDYKMKLELGMHVREIQRDFYGKRGISIHGFYVIAQVSEDKQMIEVLDLWSDDTKQDSWFTQNALDVGFGWLERVLPNFRIFLFSDNGPHYHNTAVLAYLSEVNNTFGIQLAEYNNFEAGEGKTVLDTHFAHISHKLIRWVRVGNNLDNGDQLAELLQSMKNVRCRKLTIDRSRAPSNIGTLKDISLYGNFKFPTTGPFAKGIILRPLAGIGKELKKTQSQVQAITHRTTPIANNTGAVVSDDILQSSDETVTGSSNQDSYSINFIQQSSLPVVPTHIIPASDTSISTNHVMKLPSSFAIKKGGAKRTTFSDAQKRIMIEFYDQQKNSQIRADPKAVIRKMKEQGIPELKETQIKSWWSTYHRKQKQLATDLLAEAQLINQQVTNGTAQDESTEEIDFQDTQQDIPIPSPNISPQSQPSAHTNQVIEWVFDVSQSNISGRLGSNACCFIALCMGSLLHNSHLPLPTGNQLPIDWKNTFEEAMLKGNSIHDDLFDLTAVNVEVDDAVAMAGDEFKVKNVLDQMDVLGNDPIGQLGTYMTRMVTTVPLPSFSILTSHGRSVLFVANTDKSCMIIDSHSHGSRGAIIAFCKPDGAPELGHWFAHMMQTNWNTTLQFASFHRIEYL